MTGKGELSASQVRALTRPGKHRVAPNLFLFIANGRRSWMFRGKLNGREVWRGLGAAHIVPLRETRAAALEMRLEIHKGALPSRRRREQACPSFEAMAAKYIATHEKGWRDPRASRTWRTTPVSRCARVIGTQAWRQANSSRHHLSQTRFHTASPHSCRCTPLAITRKTFRISSSEYRFRATQISPNC
jgi:hypothetical protein